MSRGPLGHVEIKFVYGLGRWFPNCAPCIPRDPRPAPRRSVDTFL